jgi:hypothetical protein
MLDRFHHPEQLLLVLEWQIFQYNSSRQSTLLCLRCHQCSSSQVGKSGRLDFDLCLGRFLGGMQLERSILGCNMCPKDIFQRLQRLRLSEHLQLHRQLRTVLSGSPLLHR